MDKTTSPRITNLVVKFVLNFEITLNFLQFVLDKVDYRPKRFNGAIVKDFGVTLLVFRNGKVNVVGAKSLDGAETAMKKFCELMGHPYTYKQMDMVNLVATASVGKQLNLTHIAQKFPSMISYHPELYPAAYYTEDKHSKPKVLIFHTGKLVFTGFKSFDNVNNIYCKLLTLFQ